ncbi:MAG: hypothetical protein C4306_11805, partial [Thermoleophilia bacterium]
AASEAASASEACLVISNSFSAIDAVSVIAAAASGRSIGGCADAEPGDSLSRSRYFPVGAARTFAQARGDHADAAGTAFSMKRRKKGTTRHLRARDVLGAELIDARERRQRLLAQRVVSPIARLTRERALGDER